jgi:hypothetical protein
LERVFSSQRVSPNPADWRNLRDRELLSAKPPKVVAYAALLADQVPGLSLDCRTTLWIEPCAS